LRTGGKSDWGVVDIKWRDATIRTSQIRGVLAPSELFAAKRRKCYSDMIVHCMKRELVTGGDSSLAAVKTLKPIGKGGGSIRGAIQMCLPN